MKKFILVITILAFAVFQSNGQHFEWGHERQYGIRGFTYGECFADKDGNGLFVGHHSSCLTSQCKSYALVKYDPNGNFLWDHELQGFGTSGNQIHGTSVSSDINNNIYSCIHLSNPFGTTLLFIINSDTIFLDSLTAKANLIVKYNELGTILWSKQISIDGVDHLITNSAGDIFVTGSIAGTRKLNSSGNLIWSNPNYLGNNIKIDSQNNSYILSGTQLTKLNSNGQFIWTVPFGGVDMSTSLLGTSYVATGDSIFVVNNAGSITWSSATNRADKITVDNAGNFFCAEVDGNTTDTVKVKKINLATGLAYENLYSIPQGGDIHYSNTVNSPNSIYFTFQNGYNTFLCPVSIPINLTLSVIFSKFVDDSTPQIGFAPPYLMFPSYGLTTGVWSSCKGDNIDVNYDLCRSNFNPGNIFYAELSNASGNFSNPTIIGSINSSSSGIIKSVVPNGILAGTGYRVRIRSTNPVTISQSNGYNLEIYNLNSTIALNGGPTTFCRDSKFLTCNVSAQSYQWQKNGNPISGATSQTYYPTSSGTYNVIASNQYGCSTVSSNNLALTILPRPSVSIVNNGNPYVCYQDSTQLVATSLTALQYTWKRYNQIVSGTVNSTVFYANKGGQFKVTVTDINGCTRTSNIIELTGPPSGKITMSGPLSFCNGDSVRLTSTIGVGLTYQWKKFGNNIPGATLPYYTAKNSGVYKALITDANGCVTPTQVKTVTVTNCPVREMALSSISDEQFEIYPNPIVRGETIHFNGLNGNYNLEIYNSIGQTVFNLSLSESTLDLVIDLPQGIYMVSMNNGFESVRNKMIVLD